MEVIFSSKPKGNKIHLFGLYWNEIMESELLKKGDAENESAEEFRQGEISPKTWIHTQNIKNPQKTRLM